MSKIDELLDALAWIESRAQSALDGSGHKVWSAEYLLDIAKEIRDRAREEIEAAREQSGKVEDVHEDLPPSGNGDNVEDPESGVDLR